MRPYLFPLVHFIKCEKIRLYRVNKRLKIERYETYCINYKTTLGIKDSL